MICSVLKLNLHHLESAGHSIGDCRMFATVKKLIRVFHKRNAVAFSAFTAISEEICCQINFLAHCSSSSEPPLVICTITTLYHHCSQHRHRKRAEKVRHASQIADSACPFCIIGVNAKKGTLSQHFMTRVIPPLGKGRARGPPPPTFGQNKLH